ncbi:uncharacterized protein L969DRAFT_51479 [Mixia osmundae IAM 14324]|uniref:FAD-binding PCMH-type domain-containing protein n=1 Tax=Mixia osmundae (strain CBS 9802 / IAM 14324 / JCM 22182 / KY 12970) TaxID=764103 RepID=G7DSH6_MIXOS|nr:uncharacterized protein L969DRAFT_51479 [Mixia osmundae IAM 14324]KEI37966.1 hypothetical protein L969DRAFT_51479 [Mixia osmundae IAM 14324]GAA93536.1 hypothetical protein E5Q_00180 [Mixia osmundae IAM 14324]
MKLSEEQAAELRGQVEGKVIMPEQDIEAWKVAIRVVSHHPPTKTGDPARPMANPPGLGFAPSQPDKDCIPSQSLAKRVSDNAIVVQVLHAQDVSKVILFARKYQLEISIKAGGYGAAGWAVRGDIIIDLVAIRKISITLPTDSPSLQHTQSHSAFMTNGVSIGSSADGSANTTQEISGTTLNNSSRKGKEKQDSKRSAEDAFGLSSAPSGPSKQLIITQERSNSDSSSGSSLYTKSRSASPRAADDAGPEKDVLSPADESGSGSGASGSTSVTTPSARNSSSRPSKPAGPKPSAAPSGGSSGANRLTSSNVQTKADSHSQTSSAIQQSETQFWVAEQRASPASSQLPAITRTSATPANAMLDHEKQMTSSGSYAITGNPDSFTRPRYRPDPTLHSSNSFTTSPFSDQGTAPRDENHALVTLGAGLMTRDIDRATSRYGYHIPLSSYPVGSALFLSGGFGFASRCHGLSTDNVVCAEFVLADGRIVQLRNESTLEDANLTDEEVQEQRDLWWAVRGAGSAFGVMTRLTAKAYRIGQVYSSNTIYPFSAATAPSLIKHWRDCVKTVPEQVYSNLILSSGPSKGTHVIVVQYCYLGSQSAGEPYVQAMNAWDGEICLLQDSGMVSFVQQQESVAQVLDLSENTRWTIHAELIETLSDDVIDKTVQRFDDSAETTAWMLELTGGQIAKIDESKSCFPTRHRSAPFLAAAIAQWDDPDCDGSGSAGTEWITNVICPASPGGPIPSFCEVDQSAKGVSKMFGTNWDRLVKLKEKYDPVHMFTHTFWPR